MIRRIALFVFVLFVAAVAQAEGNRSQGYVFGGLGSISGYSDLTMHVGGGGEKVFYKGVGIGAEIGYLTPLMAVGEGLGVLSLNGSYHFPTTGKWDPFVTGGYTLYFRQGSANLFNVGGGATYWRNERTGIRLEFRDHVWTDYNTEHDYGFRVAIAFH